MIEALLRPERNWFMYQHQHAHQPGPNWVSQPDASSTASGGSSSSMQPQLGQQLQQRPMLLLSLCGVFEGPNHLMMATIS